MTVDEACSAYLRELRARNMRQSTLESYRSLFNQLRAFAADARISSYLQSMAALGYNPLVAIQIALAGTLTQHYGASPTEDA